MKNERGLSASPTPGNDQCELNELYGTETGGDRTEDFLAREELLSKVPNPIIPTSASFMLEDDHYESHAESRSIDTQKTFVSADPVHLQM